MRVARPRRRACLGLALVAATLLVAACGKKPLANSEILSMDSSGSQTTEKFYPAGRWDLVYSWDCATQVSEGVRNLQPQFGFVVYYADDKSTNAEHPDFSKKAKSGKGVFHYTRGGPFYVDVSSSCSWRVQVLDRTIS